MRTTLARPRPDRRRPALASYVRVLVAGIGALVIVAALSSTRGPAAAGYPAAASPGIRFIYVVPLSHLDIGFTASPPEVADLQKQYLDDVLDYVDEYPQYRWNVESIWQYEKWRARTDDPAQVARFKAAVAAGKVELTAGYANSHQGQWSPEEANRFLYPARQASLELDVPIRTAIVDDVPGSSWALPQVLSANGVRNLVAGINTGFGGEPTKPGIADSLFTWRGVDGTEVLTWVSRKSYAEGVFEYYLSALYRDMEARTQAMLDYYEDAGYPYDSIIAMHAFDNTGPELIVGTFDNIDRWNSEHPDTKIIVSTAGEFFEHVRAKYGDGGFNTFAGDWSGRWETNDVGSPNTTAWVRRAKVDAPAGETLHGLARLLDVTDRPAPLAQASLSYRRQLEFDEHSGAGSSGLLTKRRLEISNRYFEGVALQAREAAAGLLSEGARALASGIRTDRPTLAVLNALSWPRSDLVRAPVSSLPDEWPRGSPPVLVDLATGATVPTQWIREGGGRVLLFRADDVPSLGYKLFALAPAGGPAAPSAKPVRSPGEGPPVIENEHYRVVVDPETGTIASLFDKRAGRELVDGTRDYAFNGAIWANQAGAVVWGIWRPLEHGRVRVTARTGPVSSWLEIDRVGSPMVRTVLRLYDGVPRLDIQNTLSRDLMEAPPRDQAPRWYFYTFPFAVGPSFEGRFQGPNGFPVPQRDWLEGTEHGARTSRTAVDIRGSDGFGATVANRESYMNAFGGIGFWNQSEPAEPTLFPTATTDFRKSWTTDSGWIPTPDMNEPGLSHVVTDRFAVTSSSGGFDPVATSRFGAGFDTPLLPVALAPNPSGPLSEPSASLLATDRDNVVVTTIKGADFEDSGGDFILRVQEVAGLAANGVRVVTPLRFAWAELDGLSEQRQGATPLPIDPVTLDIGPYQTLTIRLHPTTP